MKEKEVLEKIENIKVLNRESKKLNSIFDKSEVKRLYAINDTLLDIAERELKKEEVPSKELLDTIQMSLIITSALPWSKYEL